MNGKIIGLFLAVAAFGLLATGSAAALQSENPGYEKCYIDVCSVSDQVVESADSGVVELTENPRYEKCWPNVCSVSEQPLEFATGSVAVELTENPRYEKCWPNVCSLSSQPLLQNPPCGSGECHTLD